jgi:predicted RNase H-like HicB family nuclease
MAEPRATSRMTLTFVLEAVPHRIERDAETGQCFAINDDLHTIAEGDTQAEADANFQEALVGLVEHCLESGLPLPKALVEHRTVASA